jgi:Pyridoxamine 5'-phosphate oxidase
MGKLYAELDERLTQFISEQQLFFVATAPGELGHVNVSPKGYRDTFAVLGPRRVGYVDLTGSGAETIAHLRENGRITVMFCSFSRQPKILRLYGHGRVVLPSSQSWAELAPRFPGATRSGARAIVVIDVERIADSCGYAVPLMEPAQERDVLEQWAGRRSREDLIRYHEERNAVSIDGLPALPPGASVSS